MWRDTAILKCHIGTYNINRINIVIGIPQGIKLEYKLTNYIRNL